MGQEDGMQGGARETGDHARRDLEGITSSTDCEALLSG